MTPEPLSENVRLREFYRATLDVAAHLSLSEVLQRIVTTACTITGARYGALGILDDTGTISEFVLEGADPEWVALVGHPPEGKGLIGHLVEHPDALRLDEISAHPSSVGFPAGHPPMHSFLGIPIRIGDTVFGNLYLTEKTNGESFTEDDETLVVAFATAASVAIQNARLYEESEEFAVVRERERIARDLHDRVIQRLFATGMSLEAASRTAPNDVSRAVLARAVDELDDTIREIRSTIFELGHTDTESLTTTIQGIADELEPLLGFAPVILIEGPLDEDVPFRTREHLIIVIREALTNIAKHAHATSAHIMLRVDTELSLRISDNGIGLSGVDPATSSRGLHNMRERAELLGGRFETSQGGDGTTITWTVPLGD